MYLPWLVILGKRRRAWREADDRPATLGVVARGARAVRRLHARSRDAVAEAGLGHHDRDTAGDDWQLGPGGRPHQAGLRPVARLGQPQRWDRGPGREAP